MPQHKTVDIRALFLDLQKQMQARLETSSSHHTHAVAKGDATERCWQEMFNNYLPRRYRAERAFVVDCNGMCSDQLDVVIFDRQYSPFLLHQDGEKFIPAESVYAVFEIKQELTRDHVQYAGQKAASVRRLHRTSAKITHAGGVFKPRTPFRIVSGIITLRNTWTPPFGKPFLKALEDLGSDEQLDLGCVLQAGAFDCSWHKGSVSVNVGDSDDALITFFLRLLARLQALGTVPAIDFREYERALSLTTPHITPPAPTT